MYSTEIDSALIFEDVLGSRGRCKILKLLAIKKELNISEIIRQTNINHIDMKKHLEFLSQKKIIQEKKYGRIRIYRFMDENLRANALKNLIYFWENYNE